MKFLFFTLSVFLHFIGFAQTSFEPAMPDSSNMPIILEVAKSCHYELYFEHSKDSIVAKFANKYNWSSEKIKQVKKALMFIPPTDNAYYNAYALKTANELEKIKAHNLSLSKKKLEKLESIHEQMIVSNLGNWLYLECAKFSK